MMGRNIKLISNENYLGLSNRNVESVFSIDDNLEPEKIGISEN